MIAEKIAAADGTGAEGDQWHDIGRDVFNPRSLAKPEGQEHQVARHDLGKDIAERKERRRIHDRADSGEQVNARGDGPLPHAGSLGPRCLSPAGIHV